MIVGHDNVRIVLEGLNIFFIGWHYVHFITIKHIIQIITSFNLVPHYPSFQFDILLASIKLSDPTNRPTPDNTIQNSSTTTTGAGANSSVLGFYLIVKSVFLTVYGFAVLYF